MKSKIIALALTLALLLSPGRTALADGNPWSWCGILCGGGQTQSTQSAPAPDDTTYQQMARTDAQNAGIPADYFVNQIDAESHFNPNAVSSAGAIGIAQIMPSTARAWNVDAWDAVASLRVASIHMHEYYVSEGYDYAKALGDYNAGHSFVLTAEKGCSADWMSCMPNETKIYIHKVMG